MTKVATALLAALGLAYACLWWSFERFYGEFGVSPQDVGLAPAGSASNIAGAALQLGVWLFIVIAVLALIPVGAVIAIETAIAARPAAQRRAQIAGGAAALLLAFTAFLYWWLVDGWIGLELLAGAAVVFLGLTLLGRVITGLPARPASRLARFKRGTRLAMSYIATIVALATAVVGITFIDLPTDAAQAGSCAATGPTKKTPAESVPGLNLPFPGLHLPILSVHAWPAKLSWLSGTRPRAIPPVGVYLGEANGDIVFYNWTSKTALRIPAGDVAVAAAATAPRCHGVH